MKKITTIRTMLDRAIEQVDAIDTLGASLAAGMHAGVVIPDHVQTLTSVISAHIREQLVELAALLHGEDRAGSEEAIEAPPPYIALNRWLRRKRVILVIMLRTTPFWPI